MNLQGKVVVVTGGASGLGRAVADAAVARGAQVALFDTNETSGILAASQLGERALFVRVDVASDSSVTEGVAIVMRTFGRIDVCVNCAGTGVAGKTFGRKGPLPLKDFSRVIDINLNGTFNVLRLAVAEMAKNEPDAKTGERGVIINTASAAAFEGQMGQAAYAASKAGICGMTLPVARDLSQLGIRINTIAPGLFETGMTATLPDSVKEGIVKQLEFPKRMGDPAEFAALALHLAENPYINGEVIRIDAASRAPAR